MKSIILTFLSIFILSSCNIKNPLSKKNQLSYVDCPKSLILLSGSKIIQSDAILSLNKNYEVTCYYDTNDSENIIFQFNYLVDANFTLNDSNVIPFEFWVFLTNKNEDIKVSKQKYNKFIERTLENDDTTSSQFSFSDQVLLSRDTYESGLKIFISLN